MIRVDRLRRSPNGSSEWRYRYHCHLTSESVDELHEFAERLGLRREWFQDHPRHPHYDLTANMRRKAVAMGAKCEEQELNGAISGLSGDHIPGADQYEWLAQEANMSMDSGVPTLSLQAVGVRRTRPRRRDEPAVTITNNARTTINTLNRNLDRLLGNAATALPSFQAMYQGVFEHSAREEGRVATQDNNWHVEPIPQSVVESFLRADNTPRPTQ